MNGALGDFGYGLVLVNYGKVMVSLLTADGLVRPELAPPVVIGQVSGNLATNATGAAPTPASNATAPAGAPAVLPAAAPATGGVATHTAGTTVGGGTALTPGAAPPAASTTQINEQAEQIFEKVVLPLANPSSDPAGKFIEVAVACMLWLDNTGLKKPRPGSEVLQQFCKDTVRTGAEARRSGHSRRD